MRALAAILLIGGAAGVNAQPATEIMQIGTAVPERSEAPQPQISATADSSPRETQLTTKQASLRQPSQVTKAGRTAEPPQPISRREDGRTAAVEVVEGDDRCDSANQQAMRAASCKQVIESRAGEFARPSPTVLSPEQRLLVDHRLRLSGDTIAEATEQLARSGDSDASLEAMAVASIALGQSGDRQPEEEHVQEDSAAEAVINALSLPPPQ